MRLRAPWSHFWIAVIAAGGLFGRRTSAESSEEKDVKQFRDGDIILGAALQISSPNEDGKCTVMTTGIQLIETLNLIIDQVNANSSLLPGIKLGSIVIDTCSTDAIALKRVIREILPLALHDRRRGTNNSLPILSGVIGASRSSVSTQLAKLLGVFKIPQISYWSTSAELSDKNRFPFFFRIVPPDNYQVSAMMKFVTDQGWNYISILYDDDAYGVSGYQGNFGHLGVIDIVRKTSFR